MHNSYKHGDAYRGKLHPICRAWYKIHERCYDPNNKDFHLYGGRGIIVHFISYISFKEWSLNNGWKQGLTLDRINTNGPYSPENCRWATQKQQNNNTNKNIYLTFNNKTQTIAKWADETNIHYNCLYWRYENDWPIEKILTKKSQRKQATPRSIEDARRIILNEQ